jgi:hypothetical protein
MTIALTATDSALLRRDTWSKIGGTVIFAPVPTPAFAAGKAVPIGWRRSTPDRPLCTLEPSPLLPALFCCCVSWISCLLNYPRHAAAPSGHEHRGAIVGTVSFRSRAASRDVCMLRRAMSPAIASRLDDPAAAEATLPKGNPSEEVQPSPGRYYDLPRLRWIECLRVLSAHRRRAEGHEQAVDRFTRRERRGARPETGTPPAPSLRPNASSCPAPPQAITASTARIGQGGAS